MSGDVLRVAADSEGEARRPLWFLFRAGPSLCGVPLEHVAEVIRALPIEVVCGAPPYVRGLCIIRDMAIPVIDIGLLIGAEATRPARLAVIRTGSRAIALAADTVLGVCAIAEETCTGLPPLLRGAGSDMIAAIGIRDSELLFFLRTTRIVPDDLLEHLAVNGAVS
jgi:purine-binding chemotaxis protein CheW